LHEEIDKPCSFPLSFPAMPAVKKKRTPGKLKRENLLCRLETDIGYRFAARGLLAEALTHGSYARGMVTGNQRLEFFGDAVLGLIVSGRLLELYPESPEGELSRMRASLVDTATLADLADGIGLGQSILLGRGEEKAGGRTKKSVLAGAVEALVGAVCLDGGLKSAERVARRLFGPRLGGDDFAGDQRDYKTRLQELSHTMGCSPPVYFLENVTGPDHDLHFTVKVMVGDECFARGAGKTRREAEQSAAREVITLLEEDMARKKSGEG